MKPAPTINPYDTGESAATIADALTMDCDERAERMAALRRRVDVWTLRDRSLLSHDPTYRTWTGVTSR